MHQNPFGEIGGVRKVKLQCGQVEIALLRLCVVALDAMLFNELPNRPRQVSGSHDSPDSKKKAELNECSHAIQNSSAQKTTWYSNPCARGSQRNGSPFRRDSSHATAGAT